MKLIFEKELKNNVYTIKVVTDEVTEADVERFEAYGEPRINLGGSIIDSGMVEVLQLPNNFRRVHTQMPFVIKFAESQYDEAEEIADAWINTIENRLRELMDEFRLKTDNFTGTSEYMI